MPFDHDRELERRAHPENFCGAHDPDDADPMHPCLRCGTLPEMSDEEEPFDV